MMLLNRFVKSELKRLQEQGIRLHSIGRINKLPEKTRKILLGAIEKTASNKDMVLTLALSYGGRQEIVDAIKKIVLYVENHKIIANDISEQLVSDFLYSNKMPDPDLLIRTSGEYRVSNFLLWQIAYSEIYITPTLWPDFGKDEYLEAIGDSRLTDTAFSHWQRP